MRTPIPPPTIMLIEKDGRMAQPWYDYFLDIDRFTAGSVFVKTYKVSALPAAATITGLIAYVDDATATTQNSVVAGGGANNVLVFSNGSNWRIA